MRPGCVTTPPALQEQKKSSYKHKTDRRQCPACPPSRLIRIITRIACGRAEEKSSVFWSKASSGSSLYLFFFFICSRWRASSLSNPKEPTPTPNSSQCPDQGDCTIHRWFFFHLQQKILPPPNPFPPSCPSLRTLQYQRDWRKKESKNELYTPPYSYKDAVLDSAGGGGREGSL